MLKTARTLLAIAAIVFSTGSAAAGDYLDIGTASFRSGGALDFAGGVTCTDAASELNCTGGEVGLSSADIDGGSIDGAAIGASSAAAGIFTDLTASGTVSFSGATVSDGGTVTTVDIDGGSIDGAAIGANSAAAGTFTSLAAGSVALGDNEKLLLGDANDAAIYYDGSDLIIDPREVGSGDVIIGVGGGVNMAIGGTAPTKLLELTSNNNGGAENTVLRMTNSDLTAQTNDIIGKIEFWSDDATNSGVGAYLKAVADTNSGTQQVEIGTGTNGAAATQLTVGRTGIVNAASGPYQIGGSDVISAARHHQLRSYTVATLPSVGTAETIYVSDETGGATPAFSDGTNWRRVSDLAIVS